MAGWNTLGPRDQAALVTGVSSGLGRTTAVALARVGADVALVARSQGDLHRVVREMGAATGRGTPALAYEVALLAAAGAAVEAFGRVSVLVNAAGTDVPGPAEELVILDWDRVLAVNLRAPFVLAKGDAPKCGGPGKARSSTSPPSPGSAAGPT